MTLSTLSASQTVLGNGVLTSFGFSFVYNQAADIQVTYTDASGNQTVLSGSQYTLSLNAAVPGSSWGVGGTVTYPISGSPIANGTSITITRVVPLTQQTSVVNQGAFAPQSIEQAMDVLCMEIQQVANRTGQFRGTWATGIVYNFGDIAIDGINGLNTTNWYLCIGANTSGVWATDLANGDWQLALNLQSISNPGTVTAGGDLTGNYPNPTIAKIQGTAVTGTTGTGNVVLATSPTISGVTLAGTSVATTPGVGDNSTKIATTAFVDSLIMNAGIFGYLPSSISGTNTTASVTISAGRAVDSTTIIMIAGGPFSFAVSNGNAINGYAGGTTLPNSSTIHFFVCQGASGVGSFASTSLAPTFPTGYTTYNRRIFSLITNSSGALIAGVPVESSGGSMRFQFSGGAITDINNVAVSTANRTLVAMSVPSGIRVIHHGRFADTFVGSMLITSPDESDQAPGTTGGQMYDLSSGFGGGGSQNMDFYTLTNTSSQIGTRGSAAGNYWVYTRGWEDFRRT